VEYHASPESSKGLQATAPFRAQVSALLQRVELMCSRLLHNHSSRPGLTKRVESAKLEVRELQKRYPVKKTVPALAPTAVGSAAEAKVATSMPSPSPCLSPSPATAAATAVTTATSSTGSVQTAERGNPASHSSPSPVHILTTSSSSREEKTTPRTKRAKRKIAPMAIDSDEEPRTPSASSTSSLPMQTPTPKRTNALYQSLHKKRKGTPVSKVMTPMTSLRQDDWSLRRSKNASSGGKAMDLDDISEE
jgi:hypothetical protein